MDTKRRIVRIEIDGFGERDELPGEEQLPTILAQMVGSDWRLAEWDRVEGTDPDAYVLEFVFVPETRSREERRRAMTDRAAETASAALNQVLNRPEWADLRDQIGTR